MSAAVLVWMLPEERERLRAGAATAGMPLSAWLRFLALREILLRQRPP